MNKMNEWYGGKNATLVLKPRQTETQPEIKQIMEWKLFYYRDMVNVTNINKNKAKAENKHTDSLLSIDYFHDFLELPQ